MEVEVPTLCFPVQEKTCFACCPPIRPAGYEHLEYKNIIRRVLRENTEGFGEGDEGTVSITGFSCWALGYIDEAHEMVGCLLHPAQNGGVDFRYRVDYGEKCQREICPEAKVFSELGLYEKKFWLHMVDGLDSFSYSSRRMNPLFNLLGWGPYLLNLIASEETDRILTKESFFQRYPFFLTSLSPRANAYLISRLIREENIQILRSQPFRSKFEGFSGLISQRLSRILPNGSEGPYVHLLDFDQDFLDLLRLSARISRIKREDAVILKNSVDEETEKFQDRLK